MPSVSSVAYLVVGCSLQADGVLWGLDLDPDPPVGDLSIVFVRKNRQFDIFVKNKLRVISQRKSKVKKKTQLHNKLMTKP